MADAVSESCRYAAAVQLVSPLWGYFPDCTLLVKGLVHKLATSLRGLLALPGPNSSSAGEPFQSSRVENAMEFDINYLLLWLLSVGAAEADHCMPERDWFINHLLVVVIEVGIEDWERMRSVLVRFVWHDIFCEGPFGEVWREVEERREVLRGLENGVGA